MGAILWFGENFDDIDRAALAGKIGNPYSHDHIFHTLLGLLEIKSSVYDKSMDIIDHLEEKKVMADGVEEIKK